MPKMLRIFVHVVIGMKKAILLALVLFAIFPVMADAISLSQQSLPALALHGLSDYARALTNLTGYDLRNSSLTNWLCTAANCSFYLYIDNDNYTSKTGFFQIGNLTNATVWYNGTNGWINASTLNGIGQGNWSYSAGANVLTVNYTLAGGDGYDYGVRDALAGGSYWLDENGSAFYSIKLSSDFLSLSADRGRVNITNSSDGLLFNSSWNSVLLDNSGLNDTFNLNSTNTSLYFYDWASQSWRLWQKGYGEDKHLSGLVGWWKFNSVNGTNYTLDESGYGNDGITNGTVWMNSSSCRFGGCMNFTGASGVKVILPSSSNLMPASAITVEAWVYPRTQSGTALEQAVTMNGYCGYMLGNQNNNPPVGWNFVVCNGATNYASPRINITTNAWHHMVGTFDGSIKKVRLYVDGIFIGETDGPSLMTYSSPPNIGVGDQPGNGQPFNGLIDNVKIYNRALSADEIRAEYENSNTPDWNDPRNRQEFKWRQSFSRQFYPSINVTYLMTAADPFVRTFVDASQKYGELSAAEASDISLVGYWKLNSVNGTNYTPDSSGYGNDGRLFNGSVSCYGPSSCPQLVAGKIGNGIQFDGINDYVNASNSTSLNVSGSAITVEAWVMPASNGANPSRIVMKSDRNTAQGYDIYFYTTRIPLCIITNSTNANGNPSFIQAMPLNAWSHLACTYNGSSVQTYFNGAPQGAAALTGNILGNIKPLLIGASNDISSTNDFFNGTIDEVRVWNRSLSADEIRENFYRGGASHNLTIPVTLGQEKNFVQFKGGANVSNWTDSDKYARFNSSQLQNGTSLLLDGKAAGIWHFDEGSGTSVYDASGNGNNGLLKNKTGSCGGTACPSWTAGKFSAGLQFDGAGDYVLANSTPNINGGTQATYEAWVYPTSEATAGNYNYIVVAGDSSRSTWKPQQCRLLYWNLSGATTSEFYMDCGVNNDESYRTRYTGNTYVINNWYHVVGTFNDGTINLYVNGVLDNGAGTNGSSTINTNADKYVVVGGIQNDTFNILSTYGTFNGTIDEVRIYSRALTAAEIKEHYQSRVAEKLNPVTAFYDNTTSEQVLFSTQNRISQTTRQKIDNTSSAKFNRLTYEYDFDVKNNNFLYSLGYTTQTATASGNPSNWTIGFSNETLEAVANSTLTYYDLKDDSLAGWWKFNEGSGNTTADASGYGNTGTLYNMNTSGNNMNGTIPSGWTTGKYGNSLGFDGANDFVNASTVSIPTGDYTFSLWMKSGQSGYPALIRSNEVGNNFRGVYLDTGKIRFYNPDGTGSYVWLYSNSFVNDSNWHFITAKVAGTVASIYIDGVLDANSTIPIPPILINQGISMGKSVDANPTYYLNGTIDNVKIYSRALSADEIKSDYLAARDDYPNWAKTEISGGAEHSISPSFNYDGGAAGIWKFDEGSGSTATDSSGNGNNGNLTNFNYNATSGWTAGKYGGGLLFDGVDDYVNTPYTIPTSSDYSISVWAKWKPQTSGGGSSARPLVMQGDTGTPNAVVIYTGSLDSGASYGLAFYRSGITPDINISGFNDTNWHYLSLVRSSSLFYAYYDGAFVGSNTAANHDTSTSIQIGGSSTVSGRKFNGTIDEVRIYPRALSAGEIKEQYQKEASKYYDDFNVGISKIYGIENSSTNFSAPIDSSTVLALKFDEGSGNQTYDSSRFGNNGTMFGNMNTTLDGNLSSGRVSTGKFANALVFDGVNDYVSVDSSASLNITNAITLEAWVKPNFLHSDLRTAVAKWSSSQSADSYLLGIDTSGNIRFYLDSTGTGQTSLLSSNKVSANSWSHIAATWDGSIMRVFLNGIADTNTATFTSTIFKSNFPVYLGKHDGGNPFNGTIDDVRIYNRALSPEEIRAAYEGGVKRYSGAGGTGNIHKVANLNDFYYAQYPAYNLSDTDTAAQQDYDQRLLMITGASKQVSINITDKSGSLKSPSAIKLLERGEADSAAGYASLSGTSQISNYTNEETYELLANITTAAIRIFSINLTNLTGINAKIIFDNDTLSTFYPSNITVTNKIWFNTTQQLGSYYIVNFSGTNLSLLWRKCLSPPCTEWAVASPLSQGNFTSFNLTYSDPEILGGIILNIANITVNLALHIGSIFADDSLQNGNNYDCVQDGSGWFGLTAENPRQAQSGNLSSDYNINVSGTSDNKIFLAVGKGGCANFRRYVVDVQLKRFLSPLMSFSYAKTNLIQLILQFNATDITTDAHWGKGAYQLSIANQGYNSSSAKQNLAVGIIR